MSFLRISNVIKRFADVEVLKGINIEIEKGDFLVLVGPSGCGKSTLLNMVAGLDTMTEGEIWIGDQVMNDVHPSNRDIAMVFQSYALYPNMTVGQNISFGLEMRKVPKAEREEAVARVAKLLQIDPLLKRKPSQLSGGQRQRVAMGRALVRDPRVFLFDEPLSNLDAKLRVDMRTEIKLMHQRMGVTVVYVTHDQIEAMTLATRIAVLKAGELQQLGSPQMVYDDPANTFVAGFMGSPSMNLVPGRVREHDGKLLAEIATGEDGTVALPFARDLDGLARYKDQEVIVGVRPEAITDTQSANRDEGVIHEADLRVEVTEPTGSDTFVVTALGGKEVVARMRVNAPAKAGQSCRFAFDVSRMVAFDRESEERIR